MAGAGGPPLASLPPPPPPTGRLTPDLILRAPQFMNCLGDYEIDLRGNKVSTIENLGVTQNQFDTLDLSDNAIARLDGFPRLPRARTLLAHGNRISALGSGLPSALPSLTTLGLGGNRLARLADLDVLGGCPRLTHLVISGNPAARHPQARPYLAWRCRALRSLDGARVTPAERAAGDAEFGGEGEGGAAKAAAAGAKTFEPGEGRPEAAAAAGEGGGEGEGAAAAAPAPPSAADLARVRAAIAAAATLEEVAALEAALARGDGAAALALVKGAEGVAAEGEGMEEG